MYEEDWDLHFAEANVEGLMQRICGLAGLPRTLPPSTSARSTPFPAHSYSERVLTRPACLRSVHRNSHHHPLSATPFSGLHLCSLDLPLRPSDDAPHPSRGSSQSRVRSSETSSTSSFRTLGRDGTGSAGLEDDVERGQDRDCGATRIEDDFRGRRRGRRGDEVRLVPHSLSKSTHPGDMQGVCQAPPSVRKVARSARPP